MDKANDLNWDDLRVLLALSQHGSTTAAANDLGVSHQTVARRISQLEQDIGAALVNRDAHPWTLTVTGQRIAEHATRVHQVVGEMLTGIRQQTSGMTGTVRITSITWAFDLLIMPALSKLQVDHPQLRFEYIADYQALDLQAGHADLALRFTMTPPQDLIGTRIADVTFGVYGTPQLLDEFAMARDSRTGATCRMIDLEGAPPHRPRIDSLGVPLDDLTRVGDFSTLVIGVQHGVGIGILPDLVGRKLEGVHRSTLVNLPNPGLGIWLLKTQNLRGSQKLRAAEAAIKAKIHSMLAETRTAALPLASAPN